MAEIEKHGQLTQVDENGDVTVMYPHTTVNDITGILPISKGGTGAIDKATAYHDLSTTMISTANTSLDDYKSSGWYYFPENVKPTDSPTNSKGYLYVVIPASSITQLWFTQDMTKTFSRTCISNTWSNWNVVSDIFHPSTESDNGTRGLVPAPGSGKQNYYLKGNATWDLPLNAVELINNNDSTLLLDSCTIEGNYWRASTNDIRETHSYLINEEVSPIKSLPTDILGITISSGTDNDGETIYSYDIRIPAFNLQVIRTGSNNYMQLLTTSSAAKKQYRRWYNGIVWTVWEETKSSPIQLAIELDSTYCTEKTDNDDNNYLELDLNRFKSEGLYYYWNNNSLDPSIILSSSPVNTAFNLQVIRTGSNNYMQLLTTSSVTKKQYRRWCYGSAWTAWEEVTPIMTGATENLDGTIGLVPAPKKGEDYDKKFLCGDGSWVKIFDDGGNIIGNPDVSAATGVLDIEHGGTGSNEKGNSFFNLAANLVNSIGADLNNFKSKQYAGYHYFSKNATPENAPVPYETAGYLFVIVGGGNDDNDTTLIKQIWITQGNKYTHQDIYIRTRIGNGWQPWIKIKNRRVALVGNDTDNQTGWYKVASGYLDSDSKISLMFTVHDTKICSSGILILDIINTNGEPKCDKFSWLVSDNIDINDYIINLTASSNSSWKWDMFYKVPSGHMNYRHVFEVIEESGLNKIDISYELFSNKTKENTDPLTSHSIKSTRSIIMGLPDNLSGRTPDSNIGENSIAIGSNNESSQQCNVAIGTNNVVTGIGGNSSLISGYAVGIGESNNVHAPYSFALGNGNSIGTLGGYSVALGYNNTINNKYVFAFGHGLQIDNSTDAQFSMTIGRFNNDTVRNASFVIGNGWDSADRSNAFRIDSNGKVYTATNGNYNTSGADYSEFIKEWYDGNPNNEDRVGYMVTIKDGYLHKANYGDYIIGITSGNPAIIGNSDEDYYWKYERDRFNRVIYDDIEEYIDSKVTKIDDDGNIIFDEEDEPVYETVRRTVIKKVPRISSNYDPSLQSQYIERKDRPEWDYVGMRGIVPVRDDGTCEAGGFCKCGTDGIATKAETRGFDTFYVIERIDGETVSVEVR